MEVNAWLSKRMASEGLQLTQQQLDQFAHYHQRLIEFNQVMNLTTIVDRWEVGIKHFYDSLTIGLYVDIQNLNSLIDIGTGAGFPGIPLKIAFPHLRLVLLDSLKKRVSFLEQIGTELGFSNVTYAHGRAEEFGQKEEYRERFDLATARAVARLNVLAEYGLPFTKVGGYFMAMKGPAVDEEIEEAANAFKQLGGASIRKYTTQLPQEMGERNVLCIQKRKQTPKRYPRRPGIPRKEPIN